MELVYKLISYLNRVTEFNQHLTDLNWIMTLLSLYNQFWMCLIFEEVCMIGSVIYNRDFRIHKYLFIFHNFAFFYQFRKQKPDI